MHSRTAVLPKETNHGKEKWRAWESFCVSSHKQGSPFPAAPVKEESEGSEGRLGCTHCHDPGGPSTRQSSQSCTSVFSVPPLWVSRGQAAVLSPRRTLVCCPQLSPQYSDGILPTVLVNLKCQLVPRHIYKLVRAEATEGATSANPKTWKSPLLSGEGGGQRPPPPPPLLWTPGHHRLD